ncbi:MAG: hypothetical protein ONB16_04530 [candidate division KSB1 bacterium]|nr:hypothetical protein [candidate division KSB1 bacterium]
MKSKVLIFIISLILLTPILRVRSQDISLDKKLNREKPIDLAAGILAVNNIDINFYNNGNFISDLEIDALFSSLVYKKTIRCISELAIWIGIPEGEWTPKIWSQEKSDSINLGPTVSGSYFYSFFPSETDWGPVRGSRSRYFSGDLLLSDLYKISAEKDLPLLANSHYSLTWPENIYGERVWPGKWAIDSETGQAISGQFRADQEVLFSFTDVGYADRIYPEYYSYLNFLSGPLRGYDIGIKAEGTASAFNESYARDFIIIELNLINVSGWNYSDVYIGIYFYPIYSIIGEERGKELWRNKCNHHFSYITTEFEPELARNYAFNLSYYSLDIPNPLPQTIPSDVILPTVGIKLLETPIAKTLDGKDNNIDGKINEVRAEQLGLTDWHWLNNRIIMQGGYIVDWPLKRGELMQYKIMSGDTSNLLPVEQDYFFYPKSGALDPHFDRLEEDDLANMGFWDTQILMSSGPFDWPSGDTVKFAFAVVFGDNLSDLKTNCRIAQTMYDNNYRRMGPPTPPTVTAVPGDKTVTLYWDNAAEKDVDFLTGYNDFEGYRIYRTSVDPTLNQWGERILDGAGKLISFVPVAQFDLPNKIQGLDPQYPHLQLGTDSGLRHAWTDTSVKNGVTYWYAVCAYDQGIRANDKQRNPNGWPDFRSLENSRGVDPQLSRNLVWVVPGAAPSNYQPAGFALLPLPGTRGNGRIVAELIDPAVITGHTYTISFDDTSSIKLSYSVKDEVTDQFILEQITQVSGEEGPVFDGVKLQVKTYERAELLPDSSGWFRWPTGDTSTCNYSIKASSTVTPPELYNYEIRFTTAGDTSFALRKRAPFQIWNVTTHQPVDWEIFTNSPSDNTDSLKAVWSSGDVISVREKIAGAWKFPWQIILTRNPTPVYTERDTIIDGYHEIAIDTMIVDNPPKLGDAARIVCTKPFHSGDRFCLQTQRVGSRLATKDDLSQVKVVPNPYLVSAGWELHGEDHRLAFIHLPAKCEIIIFNVTGEVVAILKHDDLHSGTTFWNLQSHEGMEAASGLYLYVVKTPEGKKKDGKFVVIR